MIMHLQYHNVQDTDKHYRCSLKATFHLTISMRWKRAMGKIQRNTYHHGKNAIGVFDLHGRGASECHKSLSEE